MAGEQGSPTASRDTYSPAFAFIYIFNLIIGVGALSLPRAFSEAGLVLGTILLVILCGMSLMTATYMVEAMAAANAYVKLQTRRKVAVKSSDIQRHDESVSGSSDAALPEETTPLISPLIENGSAVVPGKSSHSSNISADDYEIVQKFEMGTMANMFFHPIGIVLYYICICIYLYGDIAIYAVAIPKSLTTVICPDQSLLHHGNSSNGTNHTSDICFKGTNVTRQQAYYIFLALTAVLLWPWTFFNLTRSKYLQLVTIIMRNIAFAFMIGIAVVELALGHHTSPRAASAEGFPILFGVSVYAFMVHHSLPGMITPMKSKKRVLPLLTIDYALILVFYLTLTYTGAFRYPFSQLQDLYSLNFFIDHRTGEIVVAIISYYIALFPVFTLTTNFPIISITLRENLKSLAKLLLKPVLKDREIPHLVERIVFPLIAVVPPFIVAFATQKEEILVSITGSFPGIGIQYIVPVALAFAAKYTINKQYGNYTNKHSSPVSHGVFLVFVLIWTVISILLIVAGDVLKIVKGTFTDD